MRSLPAHTAEEAVARACEVGFPVAMKILSPDIPHKTDVDGVRLDLVDERDVRGAYGRMMADVARKRPEADLQGVLIEPMYREKNRRELMIGVVRDPVFGPAISFGLGGIFVEVIRDRAVALPPLNQFLMRELIRRTRAAQALQPLRGAPAADEEAVEQILLRVSEIVCELPTRRRDGPEPADRHRARRRRRGRAHRRAALTGDGASLRPHGDPPVPERAARQDGTARRRGRHHPPDPSRGRGHRERVRPRPVGAVEVPALHVRPQGPHAGDAVALHADRL